MLAALSVCAAALLAAATPGVALAVHDLAAAQDRVAGAALAARAVVLAHDLADERDDAALRAAAPGGADRPAADRSRTDRQVQDVAAAAPAEVRTALAGLPALRTAADTGKGGPAAVLAGYQPLIDALERLSDPVTAPLGRAVDAAGRQRGLLVAALTAGGAQRGPVAQAQAARLQEQAALAEFRATAPAELRTRYDRTVTGSGAAQAESDLAGLLGSAELTRADHDVGAAETGTALTARISLMRSVEASAAADATRQAASHRDHQVTVLELRVALAVLSLLVLVGVLVTLFKTLTRPLAALHRWSRAEPDSGQGAKVVGTDEFAAVARRANALTHEAQALRARVRELTAERDALTSARQGLLAEREGLLRARDDLLRGHEELGSRLASAGARNAAQITYVSLGLRTLGLVERQLDLIGGLEEREQDPERLDQLFKLDHLATRMRRNSENLLVLAGTEHSHGATARPVPLIDVARAAISETERYERVRIRTMPDARVAGRAADDIGHLVAELLDNATGFSAPDSPVHLSGWLLETGEVMLSVEDSGIGMPDERVDGLNELLADPEPAAPSGAAGIGLYVVARLAHRHGVRTQVRRREGGGTTAVAVLPQLLLPEADPNEPPITPIEAVLAGAPLPDEAAPHPAVPSPASGPGLRSEPGPRSEPAARPQSASRPEPGAAAVPHGREESVPAGAERHDRAGSGHGGGESTATGLPRRAARSTPLPAPEPRRPRGGSVDAAELRRRLGGLQAGLQAGRRDVEHEISTGTGPIPTLPGAAARMPARGPSPLGAPVPGRVPAQAPFDPQGRRPAQPPSHPQAQPPLGASVRAAAEATARAAQASVPPPRQGAAHPADPGSVGRPDLGREPGGMSGAAWERTVQGDAGGSGQAGPAENAEEATR